MFCDQCGSENPALNRFCGQCGAKLESANGNVGHETESPVGPVSSEFRREVEQQQLRLQRLNESPVKSYSDLATTTNLESSAPEAETVVYRGTHEEAAPDSPTIVSERAVSDEASISGPSFLGLSGSEPRPDQDLTYLYDDEPRPGKARKVVALLIALGFLAFVAYQWKQNPNWQTTIVGRINKARGISTSNAGSNQPAPISGQNPDSSGNGATANASSEPKAPTGPAAEQANTARQANSGSTATPEAGTWGKSTDEAQKTPASGNDTRGNPESREDRPASSEEASRRAGTNSTGAQGEQASADTEGIGEDATTADHEPAPPSPAKAKRNVAITAAKADEPGKDLVAKADAYLYGRGVPQNCQQALVYLRTAANRGNSTARSKLGGLYATGHCVPLDRAEAYNWFTLARDAGNKNVWIDRNREILWGKMTADEKARTMEPPR